MNSRAKGARGERELRDELRAAGFLKSRRGQQFSGGSDSPDVICEDLPTIHFESKRVEKGNPYDWMDQAERDAGNKTPIVWHKRNHRQALIIMNASDFFTLIKETDRVQLESEAAK